MLSLNLSQVDVESVIRPGRRHGESTPAPAGGDGGEGGGLQGAFWKIVATLGVAVLTWIGTQLLAIPDHAHMLREHETRLVSVEEWRKEEERRQRQASAATDELIALLKAEQGQHPKRRR